LNDHFLIYEREKGEKKCERGGKNSKGKKKKAFREKKKKKKSVAFSIFIFKTAAFLFPFVYFIKWCAKSVKRSLLLWLHLISGRKALKMQPVNLFQQNKRKIIFILFITLAGTSGRKINQNKLLSKSAKIR
jgi:hypothetical protein